MNRSDWNKIRRQTKRFADAISAPRFDARTGFKVESHGRGHAVMNLGDFDEVEAIKDDLENLYIWIWNAKDYLTNVLAKKTSSPEIASRMVNDYVNQNCALRIAADVANTAKHAELRNSRSDRFAQIGHFTTSTPVFQGWEDAKTRARRIKESGNAFIAIEDRDGEKLGDAVKIALEALDAWERFAAKHGLDR